jgi:hypothetical protein
MTDKVCTSCGFVGKPIRQCFESFLVDAMAWLVFSSVALISGVMYFLLVPAAWTVYHIARFGSTKCPKCESLDMVSMNSSKGKHTLEYYRRNAGAH